MIKLVLSCGNELPIDRIALDAYGINEGDAGWCLEHPDATVETIIAIDPLAVRDEIGESDERH